MTRIKESANTVIYVNGNYIENQTIHVHQGGMLRKKTDYYLDFAQIFRIFALTDIQIYRYTPLFWKNSPAYVSAFMYAWDIFENICMYLYVYFLLNTMTLLKKKHILLSNQHKVFFILFPKRILVYSVNKQKVKEQKTQHIETANTTRCLCKVNTLKSRTQHVVFAAGMNIFMSNLKSSTNWPAD